MLCVTGQWYFVNMRSPSAGGTRAKIGTWCTKDTVRRDKNYVHIVYKNLSTGTVSYRSTTNYSARSVVFQPMSLIKTVLPITIDYRRTPFPYRIFRLARTIHQLKFIRMFPSLYYLPYTPGCTQGTRQVLSLLRLVYSDCIDPLCQVRNLPFVHWNISRIVWHLF